MTRNEIRNLAENEDVGSIDEYINLIKETIKKNPNGYDLNFPHHLVATIITKCDRLKIPVYNVCENTISVAASYIQLNSRENRR